MGLPPWSPRCGGLCGRDRILTRHLQSQALHSLGRRGGIRDLPPPLWALRMEGCAGWRQGLQFAREKCQGVVFTFLRFMGPKGPPKATFHSGKHGGGFPAPLVRLTKTFPAPPPPDSHDDQHQGSQPLQPGPGHDEHRVHGQPPAQQREDRVVQGRGPPRQG